MSVEKICAVTIPFALAATVIGLVLLVTSCASDSNKIEERIINACIQAGGTSIRATPGQYPACIIGGRMPQ